MFSKHRKTERILVIVSLVCLITTSTIYWRPSFVKAAANNYAFTSSGDYTHDSTKVQFSSGQAQLGRAPSWWDSNYAYRKKITVTASSTTSITTSDTITANIDIASLVTGAKMQADQDDLRIVYWNGSANSNIDRDYLANGLGAVAATPGNVPVNSDVRFKAQAATSTYDNGYYLYYGYASATAGPVNPTNIYSYYNPFNATGTWNVGGIDTWQINMNGSGRLQKTATEASDKFSGDTGYALTFGTVGGWYSEVTSQRTVTTNTVAHAYVTSVTETTTKGYRTTTFGAVANDLELWYFGGKISDGNVGTDYGTFVTTTGVDYRSTMRLMFGTNCAFTLTLTAWIDGTTRHNRVGGNTGNCATMYPGVHTWTSQASWDDYKAWSVLDETTAIGSEETLYPNDDPTIQPATATTFDTLSGFAETATKNGGEVKYIISNDSGATWYYYSGGWVASNAAYAQANTATDVNTNIATFPKGSGSFLFKAFLHSDGTQLVQLDNVAVTYNNIPSATQNNGFANWQGGQVTVNYKLIDSDTDTLNISQAADAGVEYSLDNATWADATRGSTGDALTGLVSSASPGTSHTFVWNSTTDLAATEDSTVYVRIKPNDATANANAWATTTAFGLDNVAPSAVGAPTFGTITSSSINVVKPTVVTNNGSDLNQWQARRSSTTALGSNASTTASVTDTGLSENTAYTYDVQFSDFTNNTSTYGTSATKYTLADTPTNLVSTAADSSSITMVVDSFPNDTVGLSGYYFSRTDANSGWIQTNSWTDSTIACGQTYTYSLKYRNGDGTDTAVINKVELSKACSGTGSTTGGTTGGGGGPAPVPPAPPAPSPVNPGGEFRVLINGGTIKTNNRVVNLDLSAGANTVRMAISMDGSFNDAGQEDFRASRTWDLCSSYIGLVTTPNCPDGTYTIYVKFYSASGIASAVAVSTITLNTKVVQPAPTPSPTPVVIAPKPPVYKPPVVTPPSLIKHPLVIPPIPTPVVVAPPTPTPPTPTPAVVVPSAPLPTLETSLKTGQTYFGTTQGYVPLTVADNQTLELVAGSKIRQAIKTTKPVKSVTVRIIFKQAPPTSYLNNSFFRKLLGVKIVRADQWQAAEYTLTDENSDGIYEGDINMPLVAGEYTIDTTILYQDGTVEKDQIVTLIDPRGYVYEKIGNKEARIPKATVTLYFYNQSAGRFEVWPAKDFGQNNPQVTDKTGEYEFLVPEGRYYLDIIAKGYPDYKSKEFTAKRGDFISMNMGMTPSQQFDMRWLLVLGMFIGGLIVGRLIRRRKEI